MTVYAVGRPYVRLNGETQGRWVDIDIDKGEGRSDDVVFIATDQGEEVFRLSVNKHRLAMFMEEQANADTK